jgi:membrane protease YdiL (CAAX protease family)
MPEAARDNRNPDQNRRALGLELGLVLLVLWLPLFLAGFSAPRRSEPHSLFLELYGMAREAGGVALLLYVLWRNHESWRHIGLRRCRWWAELLWAGLIYVTCWIWWFALDHVLSALFGPATQTEASTPKSVALMVPALLVAAIFEEVFIRGYLWCRLLRLTGSKPLALAGSSLLFTAYHPYSLRELAYIFTFGLVQGLFYWQGRSLPRLILAHTAFNLAITYGWS